MLKSIIRFFLDNTLVSVTAVTMLCIWGVSVAPFDYGLSFLPRDPVPVDAIPDIGENQQIVFTRWPGRSPQDVEDQITYPLTTTLLGIPGIKSVRSNSMFGFSSIYLVFEDDLEFYWTRSRILEKLNALPPGILPDGVAPSLGPDATALGQIFWYTLEGHDSEGNPAGGWDLHELRSVQDFQVRYALLSAKGVAEVASVGGYVREYQVDIDPRKMETRDISITQVMDAIKQSNLDVGAQTMEINLAEYFVRGIGSVKSLKDVELAVVAFRNDIPVYLRDIATVSYGPAGRRGVLDKSGAEAVGGVVVARYGANPLEVIEGVKRKIKEIAPGLPSRVLSDGTVSRITIVPFYDRSGLIMETIGTLEEALTLEILITVLVIILMVMNLKLSLLVSGTLPVAVLICFLAMRYLGVDANVVALSGIAIAIGTMVDMGIVLSESMLRRMETSPPGTSLRTIVYKATLEVGSAVVTAVATTVISFLPVFAMEAAEGKLFRPLAMTKTFALIASVVVSIAFLPLFARLLFSFRPPKGLLRAVLNVMAIAASVFIARYAAWWAGITIGIVGFTGLATWVLDRRQVADWVKSMVHILQIVAFAALITWLLAQAWMPLGIKAGTLTNAIFVAVTVGLIIGFFSLIIRYYESILRFLLSFRWLFLAILTGLIVTGVRIMQNTPEEFMPTLDEGSFLLMPTSMPHAGMEENIRNLQLLDMSVSSIPEVSMVVGKAGRVESALDPAPMSMYENVILYKSEYKTDDRGRRMRFRTNSEGAFVRDESGNLVEDAQGQYFRQWRDHISGPADIWNEIVQAARLPGVTSAPKLQPIETRLVMLQTGMRAPMGIKVKGPDLRTIEQFGFQLEEALKNVDGVKASAVFADRIVGKPYILLDIDREAIARYGLTVGQVQTHIQAAIGGMAMTTTVEGRERYAIRVRYPRELRSDPEGLSRILVTAPGDVRVPLGELVRITYERGPQAIKSEDGFLVGYVLFDKEDGLAEVEVVSRARAYIQSRIETGNLIVPNGISWQFAGTYEQQQRASERLSVILPAALALVFLLLYLHFRSIPLSAMVFGGVFVAFSGGFILLYLYGQPWFLDGEILGVDLRQLFQIAPVNLSVAVWVGFLALFGIATDDGLLVGTFLQQSFAGQRPTNRKDITELVVAAGLRRVRPAMMTTATTILALLPILTSTGKGADIMVPMAIPTLGGMLLQTVTMFTVPVVYAIWQEFKMKNVSPEIASSIESESDA